MKKIALALLLMCTCVGFAVAGDADFYTQQNIELDGNWGASPDVDC